MKVKVFLCHFGGGGTRLAEKLGIEDEELSMDAVSIRDVIHQVVSMSQLEPTEWWLSRMFNKQNRLTAPVRVQLNDQSNPTKEYDLDAILRDGDVIYLGIG